MELDAEASDCEGVAVVGTSEVAGLLDVALVVLDVVLDRGELVVDVLVLVVVDDDVVALVVVVGLVEVVVVVVVVGLEVVVVVVVVGLVEVVVVVVVGLVEVEVVEVVATAVRKISMFKAVGAGSSTAMSAAEADTPVFTTAPLMERRAPAPTPETEGSDTRTLAPPSSKPA